MVDIHFTWMRNGSYQRKKGHFQDQDQPVLQQPLLSWKSHQTEGVRSQGSVLNWLKNKGLGFTSWGVVSPCSSAGVTTVIPRQITHNQCHRGRLQSEMDLAGDLSVFSHSSVPSLISGFCLKKKKKKIYTNVQLSFNFFLEFFLGVYYISIEGDEMRLIFLLSTF